MALRLYPNDRISNYSYHHTSEDCIAAWLILYITTKAGPLAFILVTETQPIAFELTACCISLCA